MMNCYAKNNFIWVLIQQLLLSILVLGCQGVRKTTKIAKYENTNLTPIRQYSDVRGAWIVGQKSIIDFENRSIFFNDYLSASSKDNPPAQLVYFFEDVSKNFLYKLIIYLNKSTEPMTLLTHSTADRLSCSDLQFEDNDFRRQSCFVNQKEPVIRGVKDIYKLYDLVVSKITPKNGAK